MSGLRAVLLTMFLAALAGPAAAHHAPNSFVRFDFRQQSVRAVLMLPVSELEYSMGAHPTPQTLAPYLLRHVAAATPQGGAWSVRVQAVRATQYLDLPYLVAEIELAPPAGSSARDFLFNSDVVTHEVRNHVLMLVAERDYADAGLERAPQFLGALQYPQRQLAIHRPVNALRRRVSVPAAG